MRARIAAVVAAALVANVASAQLQAIDNSIFRDRVITRPQNAWQATRASIDVRVNGQAVETVVTQTVRNTDRVQREAILVLPIPRNAAVTDLVLMVDGQELPGEVLQREKAEQRYEEIVRRSQDPALLRYMDHDLLQTNVFPVPAGKERTITLKLTSLAEREGDGCAYTFPIAAPSARAAGETQFSINVSMTAEAPLKAIYSPTHGLDVSRREGNTATASWKGPLAESDAFRLLWSYSEKPVGATLLSWHPGGGEDGYYLLLAAPEIPRTRNEAPPKNVVFVLDSSGSMSGQKIEQAKGALRFVLNGLNGRDLFSIVAYDTTVNVFRPEPERVSTETRRAALDFVDSISAGGSTNISGALDEAMRLTRKDVPSYVFFLTDGLPTAGEKNPDRIAQAAKAANRTGARIFSFGVGYDLNARLLERLSADSGGASEYVTPAEDIEAAVARVYGKMGAPALTGVKLKLDGATVSRPYPKDVPDLFAGGQIVQVGRYRRGGDVTIRISGDAEGSTREYDFPARLAHAGERTGHGYIERLWAIRRIGDITSELDMNGHNDELVKELTALSTKYGILTPYTAFLAEENVRLDDAVANSRRVAGESRRQLAAVSGESAVAQRKAAADFRKAESSSLAFLNKQSVAASRGLSAPGAADFSSGFHGADSTAERVLSVSNKALYLRDSTWRDPSVTDADLAKATRLVQFTPEWFEIARSNADLRPFLSLPEGAIVRVGGKVWRIVPAKP